MSVCQGFLSRLTFDRFAAAMFFIMVATVACLMPIQSDTWWQLRGGQELWQTGAVPMEETYSHTAAGNSWMNHEWLSEAVFYAAFQTGGLPLLIVLAAGVATATVVITWSLMRGPMRLRLALLGLTLGVTSIAWTPRPHVFTLFLVSVSVKLIVTGRHWWLPLVFLAWANLHGGFTLGVGLVGAFWLTGLTSGFRTIVLRSVLAAACLTMTVLTPLGLAFWEELPASLARLQAYRVQEWQSPSLTDITLLPFWLVLVAFGVLVYRRRRALLDDPADRFLTLASLLLMPLALTSLRNVPPFLVLSLPTISRAIRWDGPAVGSPLAPVRARVHGAILAGVTVVAVVIVATAWRGPIPRLRWDPVSPEALAAVGACEGPLYNSYDDGGYLIWFLPERKVFLDSRQDPYPVELVQQDIRAQFEGEYEVMFDTYGIRCAFLRTGVPLDRQLQRDRWRLRYRDLRWTVLETPDGRP